MELLKEKQFVMMELFGCHRHSHSKDVWINNVPEYKEHFFLPNWNPQKYRDPWDRIWEQMEEDEKLFWFYLDEIDNLMAPIKDSGLVVKYKMYHTVKPEICWKALIFALKKMKDG